MLNKPTTIFYRMLLLGCFVFFFEKASANDTIFIAKHNFDSPVNNVFLAKGDVYVKAGSYIYKRSGQKWDKIPGVYRKYFVFYDKDFFEHDYIPKEHLVLDASFMKHLIPQQSLANTTIVQNANTLWLATGGSLFEYSVNTTYDLRMPKFSFRNIYHDQSLTVLSTYKGIFIREQGKEFIKAKGLNYSNGNFIRTRFGDLIASDMLFKFYAPDSIAELPIYIPTQYGKIRKGIIYGDSLALQLTNSVCVYHESTGLRLVTSGYEFTDVEVSGDSLLFCTIEGKLFSSVGKRVSQLGDLKQKVRDIFPLNSEFYLAAENGVFLYSPSKGSYSMIAEIRKCAALVTDNEQNLWVGTDEGLFIVPKGEKMAIPFIEKIEFNRGALTYYQDTIYAGSIQGMYVVDNYSVTKTTIPAAVNRVRLYNRNYWIWSIAISTLIIFTGWLVRHFIVRKRRISIPAEVKPTKKLSLQELEESVITNNIQTVDQLAELLNTNPVQLNRIFKNFQTTPGKFLKEVKIRMAKDLLKEGITIKEVSARVGYSVQLIRSELKKSGDI